MNIKKELIFCISQFYNQHEVVQHFKTLLSIKKPGGYEWIKTQRAEEILKSQKISFPKRSLPDKERDFISQERRYELIELSLDGL